MEENKEQKPQPNQTGSPVTTNSDSMKLWVAVLSMYVFLLVSIGFIAFWDQDFNDPQRKVGSYVEILKIYKETAGPEQPLNTDEMAVLVREIMKKDADKAGDLQELASQSFNIVLGAILAFLSASATMVFQRVTNKPEQTDE